MTLIVFVFNDEWIKFLNIFINIFNKSMFN